jgi:ectoine hydroxylase-related dioxygenase (phytanoyl-CoA dioxygenase family)
MTSLTSFSTHGYGIVNGVISPAVRQAAIASSTSLANAGTRCVLQEDWCRALASTLRQHPEIAKHLAANAVPVQCTLFEKSTDKNWLVPVHQDLSIPVAERVESPDLRGWSSKEGGIYVQPPVEILGELVAVRLHLDPCGVDDGPMIVVPGSHSQGIISAEDAVAARSAGEIACPVDAGGVLIMRPLLLHRSSKATGTSRRRVLHFLFGPPKLPFGLRWPSSAP